MLESVCASAGRPASALTRRDVALVLLARPAAEVLAELPVLRRELMTAGNPLSGAFWASAEPVLSSIRAGTATQGDVLGWLEATGTEPIRLMPDELFVWPEDNERGPVAAELHGLLVTHLEALVAQGTIDPDRLVTGDPDALASYRQIQADWLRSPLPDGRVPGFAVADEEDAEFLQAWEDAESDARQILSELLDDVGPRHFPEAELQAACARLRDQLGSDDPWHRLLRATAGVEPTSLPDDDRELWLALAAGVPAPQDEPPDGVLDDEVQMAWTMLEHSSWIAAAVVLARSGPGTVVDADALSQDAAAFDFEAIDDELDIDEDDEWFSEDAESLDNDALQLSLGLFTAVRLWQVLGAIDGDGRLTELGWWGVPESLLHAWQPSGEQT